MASNNTVTRQLSIFINDREVTNSLTGINREMARVNNTIRNLNRGSETYEQDLSRLNGELEILRENQAAAREEITATNQEVESAGTAFGNLFAGLTSGNLPLAAAGFTSVKTAIVASTRAAFAFIGTGIGATIAVLAGIAVATKEWYNYNKEVAKANSETAAITKLSGQAMNDARMRSKVLADEYEQDQKEILEAARAMVNEFDITYNEAFDSIEKGFLKGGSASDEFLSSLKEYPTFFAQAGFAVEDFQSLVNTGIDLGIYDDKLPDAIKEFALSVNEQTPAVRDALYNAFGPEFTDKLLGGVKNGSITVKDALFRISEEAERLGLNVQQNQQLTADLFRGAGEDAGGALKIFDAVTASIKNQNKALSESEKGLKDLTDSELELAKARDAFLRSEGFAMWSNRFDKWVNGVKSGFYQVLATITNSKEELERLNQGSSTADAIKIGMNDTREKFLKAMAKKELETFKQHVAERKNILGKQYDLEQDREEYLITLRQQKEKAETELDKKKYQAAIDAITNYQEKARAVNNKFSLDELNAQKKANEQSRKERQRQQEQDKKEREREAEEVRKNGVAEMKARAKAYLDYYLANNVSAIDADKALTREMIAEEQRRLDLIAAKKLEVIAGEKETNDAIIAIKRSQNIDLSSIDIEYLTEKKKLETENHQEIARLNKQYDEEQKALRAEQLRADQELAVAEAETKEEEDRLLRDQKYKEEVDAYKKMLDQKIISDDEYARFTAALDKKKEEAERLARLKKTQDQLNEMGRMADALTAMFGQTKELAIATALINGGLAVTEILATESIFPEPLASASRFIQIGGVIATVGKNVDKIRNTKSPKRAKFFYGGHTGTNALDRDEYGPVTGVVHANEWVMPAAMTQNPRYANVLGWLENERVRQNGFYNGGYTSNTTGTSPAVSAEPVPGTARLEALMEQMIVHLQNPVAPINVFGYQDVKDIDKMRAEIQQSNNNGKLNS